MKIRRINQIIDMAINDMCDLLDIDVDYSYIDAQKGEQALACYYKEDNIIFIRKDILDAYRTIPGSKMNEQMQTLRLYCTIAHECYHAFQWQKGDSAIRNSLINFKGYKELGDSYLVQEHEQEAVGFELAVMSFFIGKKAMYELPFMSKEIETKRDKYIDEYSAKLENIQKRSTRK